MSRYQTSSYMVNDVLPNTATVNYLYDEDDFSDNELHDLATDAESKTIDEFHKEYNEKIKTNKPGWAERYLSERNKSAADYNSMTPDEQKKFLLSGYQYNKLLHKKKSLKSKKPKQASAPAPKKASSSDTWKQTCATQLQQAAIVDRQNAKQSAQAAPPKKPVKHKSQWQKLKQLVDRKLKKIRSGHGATLKDQPGPGGKKRQVWTLPNVTVEQKVLKEKYDTLHDEWIQILQNSANHKEPDGHVRNEYCKEKIVTDFVASLDTFMLELYPKADPKPVRDTMGRFVVQDGLNRR